MKESEMYPSKYLAKEDVKRPIVATIASVMKEKMQVGKQEIKNVLLFSEDIKPMILNRGNGKILFACLGDDSSAWKGKRIEIYVDPTVSFAGEVVGGLRLRMPTGANGETWLWPRAIEEVAKFGVTEDGLKEALKKAGKTGYLAARDTDFVKSFIEEVSGTSRQPDASATEIPF